MLPHVPWAVQWGMSVVDWYSNRHATTYDSGGWLSFFGCCRREHMLDDVLVAAKGGGCLCQARSIEPHRLRSASLALAVEGGKRSLVVSHL